MQTGPSVNGSTRRQTAGKVVIAHRGASGYLPEHTLAGKALAYGMGAHYLEQDVVLTKDDHPIVLHDIYLDTVTDVAAIYPDRAREDGRYYAIDFTLEEIRRLRSSERIDPLTGKVVYPGRFPRGRSVFGIVTLREEIELIQGLNKSLNREVGIYPELKAPRFHAEQGKDLPAIVLPILTDYGYVKGDGACLLQCFDSETLRRLQFDLQSELTLVQLIGDECREWDEVQAGVLNWEDWLDEIPRYADGIAPDMELVYDGQEETGARPVSALVNQAHSRGMFVHPYNVRADVLPEYARSLQDLLEIFYFRIGVDGLFTDFPDRAIRFLEHIAAR